MGSVGSIEKVMVGGILAIIILILAVAINGTHDDPNEVDGWANGGENSDVPKLNKDDKRDLRNPGPRIEGGTKPTDDSVVFILPPESEGWPEEAVPDPRGGLGGDDPKPLVTPPPAEPPKNYTVKSGDNFSLIAQRVLGSVTYVSDLRKANEDVEERKMHVGQILNLPRVGKLAVGGPDGGGTSSGRSAANVADAAPVKSSSGEARTHKVVSGDTLYGISETYYGDSGRWKEIFAANRNVLTKPEILPRGAVLSIP